ESLKQHGLVASHSPRYSALPGARYLLEPTELTNARERLVETLIRWASHGASPAEVSTEADALAALVLGHHDLPERDRSLLGRVAAPAFAAAGRLELWRETASRLATAEDPKTRAWALHELGTYA